MRIEKTSAVNPVHAIDTTSRWTIRELTGFVGWFDAISGGGKAPMATLAAGQEPVAGATGCAAGAESSKSNRFADGGALAGEVGAAGLEDAGFKAG